MRLPNAILGSWSRPRRRPTGTVVAFVVVVAGVSARAAGGGDAGAGAGGGGTCAPKQMMKPPRTSDESVDHSRRVPADAFLKLDMALNAATTDVVPLHDPPRAHEAQFGRPGHIPGVYPDTEFADGYEILIQSYELWTS